MRHQEKKYKVEDFVAILRKLDEVGAKEQPSHTTYHYYAKQNTNDVTKLVVYTDRCEIHILSERNGKFRLDERISVDSKEQGLEWLKQKGFEQIQEIKMQNTDYEYDEGLVGLYIINDELKSVILDYPAEKHAEMEKLFELDGAKVISQPYNKYSESK